MALSRLLPLTVALATAGAAVAAEPPLRLKTSPELVSAVADPESWAEPPAAGYVYLEADRFKGRRGDRIEAEGGVVLRRDGEEIRAQRVTYLQPDDEVRADGGVTYLRGNDRIECTDLRLRLSGRIGELRDARYLLARDRGHPWRGQAKVVHLEGPDRYQLEEATYSTCPAGNDDWRLRTGTLGLDYVGSIGQAREVKVEFLGVPILYAPWLDFSLDRSRKSGFLTPSFGVSDDRGLELQAPWYWNLAANRDATITPRLMTRRGLQLGGEFRYLETAYDGRVEAEVLPDDRVYGDGRYRGLLDHRQRFSPRLTGSLHLEGVTDDTYFADLSGLVSQTSLVNLPREAILDYDGGWWSGRTRVQSFQTLQDPAAPIRAPYHRLPQLVVNADRHDLFDGRARFRLAGEFVRFEHEDADRAAGNRFYAYPSVGWSYESTYGYVRPKLGWHFSRYDLERNPDRPDTLTVTRNLPIFSLDSALSLEREFGWNGHSYLQTLEPRFYYVNIPNREQSAIPVFDTSLADLAQAQLFAENQFIGVDRINDANQFTLAVTSRFLEPDSGLERLQVTVGQRYYFNDQRVTLPGIAARGSHVTDLLAEVSGQITGAWRVASGFQYNPENRELVRANLGTAYRGGPGRVLNADLRYINEQYAAPLNQLDFSWQWPIRAGWHSLGRINYSFRDDSLVEGLLGFEYNAGCWALRGVFQELATSAATSSQAVYVQLELNGLTQLGPNPLETLKRNISGYVKSDELDLP